jgi:hypothetical protein
MAESDRVEIVLVGWRRGEEYEAAIAYQRASLPAVPGPPATVTGERLESSLSRHGAAQPSAAGQRS